MTRLVLQAPAGKFRVVCVDTFDGTDWVQGDYDDRTVALGVAAKKGGTMMKTHVYDDQGQHIREGGTY